MERRTALRTVATGVLAGLAIGVGTASAQLPVPDVPDVKLPDVPSVPVPQVPSVPAPAPAPQVPKPPAVPQVPQVPQVPDVPPAPAPVPSVSVPRTPVTSGGGGGGGGGGGSSSSPASSGRSSGGGGGSAATGAAGGSAAAARPASAGGDEGDDGDGRAAPQRRSTAQRRGQRRARGGAVREERLRETVHQLAGCLDELREAPRRVLVLRSGYGPVTPHSRSQVGDRLDLPQQRVKRLERRGLRRLRSLERHGGCGGGGATSLTEAGSSGGDMRLASALGVGDDTGGGGSDGGVADAVKKGLSAPASAVKDLFESSRSDGTSSSGESSNPPATVVQQPSGGIGVWSLLAFVTGLGLLGFAIRRELTV